MSVVDVRRATVKPNHPPHLQSQGKTISPFKDNKTNNSTVQDIGIYFAPQIKAVPIVFTPISIPDLWPHV